jgi:hypothetical protein
MIDIETRQPVKVNTEGDAGPYLMVPLDQLNEVRLILQERGIAHIVAEDAIQLDGKPMIAIVDFGRRANAVDIQAALDAA